LVEVTTVVVIVPVSSTSSVIVAVPPLVTRVAVLVAVGTSPLKVAVLEIVVIVLVMTVVGTVTVSVAVVDGAVVVTVADAVLVAVAVPVTGKHRRILSHGVPPPHSPAAGQIPSNLVHRYGEESGGTLPPQPKLLTQADTSWQLKSLGQSSATVQA
jgi:hypothetical protein